jgi:NAD(P)-dependent dehydrogenase (short-subunit alcohol dehydrogenase family)
VSGDAGLAGQIVLVIGGSSGIGLETARRARVGGAEVILTAREPTRLYRAGLELGASIAAFDATDPDRLATFFDALREPIDHVLVSIPGPCCAAQGGAAIDACLSVQRHVAERAAARVRPGGTLLFLGSTGGPEVLRAMTKGLALELDPVRVNLIAVGSADAAAIAALAVRVMTDRAVTGASFDIDRGPRSGCRQSRFRDQQQPDRRTRNDDDR